MRNIKDKNKGIDKYFKRKRIAKSNASLLNTGRTDDAREKSWNVRHEKLLCINLNVRVYK